MIKMIHLRLALSTLLSVCLAVNVFAQGMRNVVDISSLKNRQYITEVYLSSAMLRSSSLDFTDEIDQNVGFKEVFDKTEAMHIYIPETKEAIRELRIHISSLDDQNRFKPLFSVRSDGASVRFLGEKRGKAMGPLYLLVDDEEEMVVMVFEGDFKIEDIEKLLAEPLVQQDVTNKKVSKHPKK